MPAKPKPAPRQSTDKADLFRYYWRLIAGQMLEPEEEYNFDASLGRKHRFDFAFPSHLVAVEIEGNAWNVKGGGKHMQDSDLEKYNIAAAMGWRVFRFSPAMLKKDPDTCVDLVVEALEWNLTSRSSFDGVIISASADVVGTEPTLTTPLYTTSNEAGKAVTRNSTTHATLSSSITTNTLKGSLTQERGAKGSGKSKSNGTAKKK